MDESLKKVTLKFPSPVTYNKRIEYISDMPKYSIPKFDISKIKVKSTSSPGPGQYNPNAEVNII